jgi:uncharacterized protein YcbK (DUF882 family)
MRFARVCVVAFIALPSLPVAAAQARPRAPVLAPECNVSMQCDAPVGSTIAPRRGSGGVRSSARAALQSPERKSPEAFAYAPATAPLARESRTRASVSMAGVVPALAAKVAQIQSACPGAHVISSVRHTRIRGTRRMSLHATGEAVDMRGNPSCVYAQLRDWPGGYSTDYGRARHIHISLAANGREAGLRFTHGGKSYRHRRFVKQ